MRLLPYPKRSFDKKEIAREKWVPGRWKGEECGTEKRNLELEQEPKNRYTSPTVVPRNGCHYRYVLSVSSHLVEGDCPSLSS